MQKFVEYTKKSKKEKRKYDSLSRRTWGDFNPCTKTFKDPTKFNKCDRNKKKSSINKLDY